MAKQHNNTGLNISEMRELLKHWANRGYDIPDTLDTMPKVEVESLFIHTERLVNSHRHT